MIHAIPRTETEHKTYYYIYLMFVCMCTQDTLTLVVIWVDVGKTIKGRHYMSMNQVADLCSEASELFDVELSSQVIGH